MASPGVVQRITASICGLPENKDKHMVKGPGAVAYKNSYAWVPQTPQRASRRLRQVVKLDQLDSMQREAGGSDIGVLHFHHELPGDAATWAAKSLASRLDSKST